MCIRDRSRGTWLGSPLAFGGDFFAEDNEAAPGPHHHVPTARRGGFRSSVPRRLDQDPALLLEPRDRGRHVPGCDLHRSQEHDRLHLRFFFLRARPVSYTHLTLPTILRV